MVPDPPSLTRRRLLGSLAGLTGAGTVAVGATEPTLLPDVLTDEATKHYPTPPEVTSHWRPTVTEAHAREAVELLADTVAEGRRRWRDLDTEEGFHGAGGWLENARESLRDGDHHEALFDATYGMQFAAEALGFARARQGEADLKALADRRTTLLDRSQQVTADLRPYPTADPGLDLAWYYEIERELVFGRLNADWDGREVPRNGVDDGDGPDPAAYDPREVGAMTAGVLEAQLHVRSAERYRDLVADRLGGAGRGFATHLRNVVRRFESGIESFPSREEVLSRYVDEDGEYGPYEFAHSRIARSCYDSNFRFAADDREDLLAYRAVELARGFAQRRAHDRAVGDLVVEPGDQGFDSGHALAEKRRAQSTYQSVVGPDPPALLTRQAARAIEDLQVAKVGFGGGSQRPLWRERLEAYVYALVGRAKLKQHSAVYDAVVDRE